MEKGRKQSFVKCSALYEVHLKKSDSYDAVVEKISDVVQLPAVDGEIFLLTCRGLIINNHQIEHLDKKMNWTVGGYLTKKHLSPDKLTLGVGILPLENAGNLCPEQPSTSSRRMNRNLSESSCPPKNPKQSGCNDVMRGTS